jgi:hypothetical protein
MTDDGISSHITAIKTDLASIVEARQDIVKELEEMRQSIDRVRRVPALGENFVTFCP